MRNLIFQLFLYTFAATPLFADSSASIPAKKEIPSVEKKEEKLKTSMPKPEPKAAKVEVKKGASKTKITPKKEVEKKPLPPKKSSKEEAKKEVEKKPLPPKKSSKEEAKKEAFPSECLVKIFGNDRMQFVNEAGKVMKEIKVPHHCKVCHIDFAYDGKLSSSIMGHNIVITEKKNKDAVSTNALKQGKANNYLPKGQVADDFVLAASKHTLGGADEDNKQELIVVDMSLFDPSKDYVFFCAFPGHALMMKGNFIREAKQKKAASSKKAAPENKKALEPSSSKAKPEQISPASKAPVSPASKAPVSPASKAPVSPASKAPVSPASKAPVSPASKAPVSTGTKAN